MPAFSLTRSFLFLLLLAISSALSAQSFKDGRGSGYCNNCTQIIESMPPEVLFGIHVRENGDVYFSMTSKAWFDKIIRNTSFGVTTDIVEKSRYNCSSATPASRSLIRGTVLPATYRADLVSGMEELQNGAFTVKIGSLPNHLRNKEIEGNLMIVNGDQICFYTNFVDIDRSVWKLLPMGLYTDTLHVANPSWEDSSVVSFGYDRKIQVVVPFAKGQTVFTSADIDPLFDSLNINRYRIQKISVRAYASVEGTLKGNQQLMQARAQSLVNAIKMRQPRLNNFELLTAENWIDFFDALPGTKFESLSKLSKFNIRVKLADPAVAADMEPLLKQQRKAIVTMYVKALDSLGNIPAQQLVRAFNLSVQQNNKTLAASLQKELAERIADNQLPSELINQLEIPAEKEWTGVKSDQLAYKYLLRVTSEYEALEAMQQLVKLDPDNGKVNYNICALQLFVWQIDSSQVNNDSLWRSINQLFKRGVDSSLVKRMQINYQILSCNQWMDRERYDLKDQALGFILNTYTSLHLNDAELFALAKYFAFYAHSDWSKSLIEPRIGALDVSEDLIFYYINLCFFNSGEQESPQFKQAVLNAINLNNRRFCNFFQPSDRGGASMQLLESESLKGLYCDHCR